MRRVDWRFSGSRHAGWVLIAAVALGGYALWDQLAPPAAGAALLMSSPY
jgi:hypothetical protein